MAKPDFEVYLDDNEEDENPIEINKKEDDDILPSRPVEQLKGIEEKPERLDRIEIKKEIEKPVMGIKKKEKKDTSDGWNQGDGRIAKQVVIYESDIPAYIKNKIAPKGTHFKFVNKDDENELIRMIQGRDTFTAIYNPNKKTDITIKNSDGTLFGNIHLLHMNGPDINDPSKYYIKLYFFNFNNRNELKRIEDRIRLFFNKLERSKPQLIENIKIKKVYKKYPRYTKHKRVIRRDNRRDNRRITRRRWDRSRGVNELNEWKRTKRRINKMKNRLLKSRSQTKRIRRNKFY
jgi:hypothetical protein